MKLQSVGDATTCIMMAMLFCLVTRVSSVSCKWIMLLNMNACAIHSVIILVVLVCSYRFNRYLLILP